MAVSDVLSTVRCYLIIFVPSTDCLEWNDGVLLLVLVSVP